MTSGRFGSFTTFDLKFTLGGSQVLVTTIECISRVTVRLLGETWAGKLDALLGDMDLHYFQVDTTSFPSKKLARLSLKASNPQNSSPLPSVEVGKVYAAQAASEWHRVRVESIVDDNCLCLFLDHGDTDTIALADLRDLKPEFLMLPPQAFPVEVEDSSSPALSPLRVTVNTWSGRRPPRVPADRLENTSNSEPAPAWQVVDG